MYNLWPFGMYNLWKFSICSLWKFVIFFPFWYVLTEKKSGKPGPMQMPAFYTLGLT
jgi:hypothetical protein